ncbi:MAG: hypothetical protein MRY78_17295 [Saprospiraceae bacterium]|nr:hypothetical protein [Saprospiraceae bacterium]
MNHLSPDLQQLFKVATEYIRLGDHYPAVKILKKIVRKTNQFAPAYFELSKIYKSQNDWKGCFHYSKKTIALDAANKEAWWNFGIAATAIKRPRIAKIVWAKFGFVTFQPQTACVRLQRGKQFEILWGRQLDPARIQLYSIPHPSSGRNFQDILLIDRQIVGHTIVQQKKLPVFEELGLMKRSVYRTFTCYLYTTNSKSVEQLAQLCADARLGFEVWSNAIRQKTVAQSGELPEYISPDILKFEGESDGVQVAIAAKLASDAEEVIQQWKIITLENCSDLQAL